MFILEYPNYQTFLILVAPKKNSEKQLKIPMLEPHCRSFNQAFGECDLGMDMFEKLPR